MTDEEEDDLKLLSLTNEKRKFAVQLDRGCNDRMQAALERGMDDELFRLIDVTRIAEMPHTLFRVFRLTDAGMARLAHLVEISGAKQ